jgi:hypothetical protein
MRRQEYRRQLALLAFLSVANLIHRFVDSGRHTTQTFREQPGRRQGR